MALGDGLQRHIARITVDGKLSSRQLGIVVGTFAKQRHQQLVDDGKLPEVFVRFVDGSPNVAETSVKITKTKPGVIEYRGSSLVQAATYVYLICTEASRNIPQRASQFPAGTFSRSWRIFADGTEATLQQIPPNTTQIIVVNVTPYSRFLEQHVGVHKQRPAYMVTEIASRAGKRKYAGLSIRRQFVTLPGVAGVPFAVPYHLRRPPGGEMTYPAVVISQQER
jgi:hypothetical protein